MIHETTPVMRTHGRRRPPRCAAAEMPAATLGSPPSSAMFACDMSAACQKVATYIRMK
ncbi:Uncharacterised protein [Mycobacteroides abscessus subsp. abscessus]|nr:Uncharacterised protein [Mycobacteroides abscessus subsp. abscessus]